MPWNGSGIAQVTDGTFTGTSIWTSEKNAANLVTAAHFDTFSADLCSMLQNCFTIDGQVVGNILKLNATTGPTVGAVTINGIVVMQMKYGTAGNFFLGNSGNFSLTGQENIAIGYGTGAGASSQPLANLTSGNSNVALGSQTMTTTTTGGFNTAVGAAALNICNGTSNVGLGASAGSLVSTGSQNIFLGANNTGMSVTTGSQNVCIGYNVDVPSQTANGQLSIMNAIYGTGNTGTLSSVSTGKIGIKNKAPTYDFDVSGVIGIGTAGSGLRVKEGSNCKQGTATLVGGSAVVSNTSVTANSRIFLTSNADGGTPGWVRVSARAAGTSFTITSSSGTDTSTVAYQIFEPY